jgi:predicted DNA-binding transcriptional regulator YafY
VNNFLEGFPSILRTPYGRFCVGLGGSHLEMRLSALEEVEQFVLSWGTPATVIGPVELRERVLKTARELAARYA